MSFLTAQILFVFFQIFVDFSRCFLARAHCENYRCRARDGVTAGSIIMNDLLGSPEKCPGVFQLNDVRLSSLKGAPKQVGVMFEINPFMEDDLSALKEIDTDIKAPVIIIRGSSILRDGSPVSRNNTVTVSRKLCIGKKIIIGPAFIDSIIIVSANNTDKKKLVSILGPKVTL